MATEFELLLAGEDDRHLAAVADLALEELERVELLLTCHDPAGELARVNREAGERAVLIDAELTSVLADCKRWWERTGGWFDPSAVHGSACYADLEIDVEQRRVRFGKPGMQLNLGGYGKGYALTCLRELLSQHGVRDGFVQGGTSSVLAMGSPPENAAWVIDTRDPFAAEEEPVGRFELSDQALSSSAAFPARTLPASTLPASTLPTTPPPSQSQSDIIDPHSGQPLSRQAGCVVIAPDPLAAEVLSTALLAMGKDQACEWLTHERCTDTAVAWIDRHNSKTELTWFPERLPA